MSNWHKAEQLSFSTMQEGKIMAVAVGGKNIAAVRLAGHVFAFTAACPHAGAPLCDGWVDPAGRIVCPLHKYRFDPTNGRNTTGEGYKLFRYATQIRDDEIFISLI